jgi:hypothetical protein
VKEKEKMKMKMNGAMSGWVMVLVVLGFGLSARAGSLDSTAAPTSAGSALYTLNDIYNRLNAGTAGTKRPGAFAEPVSGPDSTMRTTDEIMAKAPAVDAAGATDAQVLADKKYWGLTAGAWGVHTGTMVDRGAVTITPGASSQAIPAGYHSGSGSVAGDADLAAGNIKKNVDIFGVVGTFEPGSAYPSLLARTGQTTSYRTGDDATYQKGVAWPNPRFTDNGNETVTDNLTGLMWTKNANLFGRLVWNTAIDNCESYSLAGYTDWRLPNLHELCSLIDRGRVIPALPSGHPFTGVQSSQYWLSSTSMDSSADAWGVHLRHGQTFTVSKTTSTYYVWPVRGGQ